MKKTNYQRWTWAERHSCGVWRVKFGGLSWGWASPTNPVCLWGLWEIPASSSSRAGVLPHWKPHPNTPKPSLLLPLVALLIVEIKKASLAKLAPSLGEPLQRWGSDPKLLKENKPECLCDLQSPQSELNKAAFCHCCVLWLSVLPVLWACSSSALKMKLLEDSCHLIWWLIAIPFPKPSAPGVLFLK